MESLVGRNINRYHIQEKIAEGGMAVVYKAHDTRLDRNVAIKIIRAENVTSEQFITRFSQEAKALAKLDHSNIIAIIDYGEFEGLPFLVMPFIPGGTLKQEMGSPIPYDKSATLLGPIANALAYAHSMGIIHRDIKPSNILLSIDKKPMLTDFGVAKILSDEVTGEFTGTGVGVGTPEYMSPEQTIGGVIDGRSDEYSLGVVFYEMITGRKPFQADTPLAAAIKQSTESLPNPRIFVPKLPKKVEKFIIKALAKDPVNRFQTLELFETGLKELAVGNLPQPIRTYVERKTIKRFWLNGFAIGIILIAAISIAYFFTQKSHVSIPQLSPVNETATVEPTVPISTVTATSTIAVPTATSTATLLPTSSLNVGSSQISPRDGMELVFVPAGKFWMGSDDGIGDTDESPRHEIYLDAYWIDKTEVTNAKYRNCVNAGYCYGNRDISSNTRENYFTDPLYEDFPVVNVDYESAKEYCQWAGRRLPSEAEWEKAAKGVGDSSYPWGDNFPDATLANFDIMKFDTVMVGSYPNGASMYGALDMAGNVWEIVNDAYDSEFYKKSPPINPQGPANRSNDEIVIRGGSYQSNSKTIRNTDRTRIAWGGTNDVGFRCVTSILPIVPTKTPLPTNPTPIPGIGQTQITTKDGMTMMFIPAGEFIMGTINEENLYEAPVITDEYSFYYFIEGQKDDISDEYPQRRIKLNAYWIDQTEVTNEMFKKFVSETKYITEAETIGNSGVSEYFPVVTSSAGVSWKKPMGPESGLGGLSNHPVVHVSWNDAKMYCEWAGKRLPTEEEWEKAARGIDGQDYPWGNSYPSVTLANFNGNVLQSMGIKTAPVGSYPNGASPFGVLDMAGNVREWTSEGAFSRGGSWYDNPQFLRSASRVLGSTNASTGFRCAMDAD